MVDGDDYDLDVEGNHPHVALGVEEVHYELALVDLEVGEELDVLVKELVGLDVAHADGNSSLGFLLEGLPLDCTTFPYVEYVYAAHPKTGSTRRRAAHWTRRM